MVFSFGMDLIFFLFILSTVIAFFLYPWYQSWHFRAQKRIPENSGILFLHQNFSGFTRTPGPMVLLRYRLRT